MEAKVPELLLISWGIEQTTEFENLKLHS